MKEKVSLPNSELKVMNKIWELGSTVTVREMVDILNAEGEEWAYQTVATFLKHLEVKGFLSVTQKGNKLCYFPLISQEQYKKNEAEGFLKRSFGGSLEKFLTAFRGSDKIRKEEIKKLKAWLDEYDDGD
ncbi:MAG: BlaI/MecI/CopY family transcriptional regulator [Epulopiscium sp.]|nr:BlaI/MecI/CopY family transcriptional regulator [Candidatus Epulonipiscium sp.]